MPWRRTSSTPSDRERSTASVGELIMSRLKDIDTVAYIRFASVYRDFKDVNEFKLELEGLLSSKDSRPEAGEPEIAFSC